MATLLQYFILIYRYATVECMIISVSPNFWWWACQVYSCYRRDKIGRQISPPFLFLPSFAPFWRFVSSYHSFLLYIVHYPHLSFFLSLCDL